MTASIRFGDVLGIGKAQLGRSRRSRVARRRGPTGGSRPAGPDHGPVDPGSGPARDRMAGRGGRRLLCTPSTTSNWSTSTATARTRSSPCGLGRRLRPPATTQGGTLVEVESWARQPGPVSPNKWRERGQGRPAPPTAGDTWPTIEPCGTDSRSSAYTPPASGEGLWDRRVVDEPSQVGPRRLVRRPRRRRRRRVGSSASVTRIAQAGSDTERPRRLSPTTRGRPGTRSPSIATSSTMARRRRRGSIGSRADLDGDGRYADDGRRGSGQSQCPDLPPNPPGREVTALPEGPRATRPPLGPGDGSTIIEARRDRVVASSLRRRWARTGADARRRIDQGHAHGTNSPGATS